MLSNLMRTYQEVDPSKMRASDFLKVQDEIEKTQIQAILEGSGWRDVPLCPLCGSDGSKLEFTKHSVSYVRCTHCGICYSKQVSENLDDVYKDRCRSFSKDDTDEHYNYHCERFGRERVGILEKYCGDLTEKYLLDIGCGNGFFLSVAMERCRHCYGTEYSGALREFTQRKTGLIVYDKKLVSFKRLGKNHLRHNNVV